MSKKYSIEFAVEASTEFKAINRLKDLGVSHADEAKLSDLDRQAGLFMINVLMLESEMTDEVYHKISKAKDVFILSDELSAARGEKILQLTLVIERQLKKLLVCIIPEIEKVLIDIIDNHQKHGIKSTPTGIIEWCQKIHDFSFGELPGVLEEDISRLARERLNTGDAMLLLIAESKDFDNLKLRATNLFETRTVWNSICSILESPVQYEHISGALNKVIDARNKAAHQNIITKKILDQTRKNQKHIMSRIGTIKSTYRENLKVNMEQLSKSMKAIMDSVATIDPTIFTEYQKQISQIFQPLTEAVARLKLNIASPEFKKIVTYNSEIQSQLSKATAESLRNMKSLQVYNDITRELAKNNFTRYLQNSLSEIGKIQPDIQRLLDTKGTRGGGEVAEKDEEQKQ